MTDLQMMKKTIYLAWAQLKPLFVHQHAIERKRLMLNRREQLRVLRNQYLSGYLQCNVQDADLQLTPYGKPYLIHHQLSFNHSHSQQHYVLACSAQYQDVGVDLEDLDRQVNFDALAQHAFHPDELAHWQQNRDIEYWFKVWTTKEAVLKAAGLGIRLNLKTLNTAVHPLALGGRCEHPEIGIFAYQHQQLGNAMCTVAWRSEHACRGFHWPYIQLHCIGQIDDI